MKKDIKIAKENNFTTVHEALEELNHLYIKNQGKEMVDLCEDLLLQYKSRIEDENCETQKIRYALKQNVILRYLKE